MLSITEYATLDGAYKHFNDHLFGGGLPEVFITLNRKKGCNGYHHNDKFISKEGDARVSEISLNPDTFGRDDIEILSTLVHEMAHLWQYKFSKPSRPGYHDKDWAKKMEEVGLMPSATGEEGGKKTGQKMTHYTIEGGAFEIHAGAFLVDRKLNWKSAPDTENVKGEKKKKNKVKYSCPDCDLNVWAKPEIKVRCGECDAMLISEEDGLL
jgi:predicted SprT family Zn-dependent metalloprotease